MRQRIERNGFEGDFAIDYVIGSGNHAMGFLIRVGDFLFQSPVSWYSTKKIWDMAPGYEGDRNPDFTRPATMECLLCHSGKPLAVADTLNRYERPAFRAEGISCERCHGAVAAHLSTPSARNILNPAKLSARARDSICEQCHLGGEARIPNPGRHIADFEPGQVLEDAFSVYVFEKPAETGLKVVSHSEQLALSQCARQSGDRMWCGTCHNPHERPENVKAAYRDKCLACHGAGLLTRHAQPSEDCVGCHMQRQPARDGGHTAFTDHRIRKRPAPSPKPDSSPLRLAAWHEPAESLVARNLGLAYITVGERDQSASRMDAGFRILSESYDALSKDPAVLTALGLVLIRKNRPVEAAKLYEQALALQPGYAPYHINVATAWNQAGDSAKAILHLEKAIDMDPSLETAYRKLGEIYSQKKEPDNVRKILQRYLKFMPDNVTLQYLLDQQ
jgi:tetratricopeptide (TPR) repeat protein